MVYGLPAHGEANWDTKLVDSIAAVKVTADAAPVGNTIVLLGNSRVARDWSNTSTLSRNANYGFFTWANGRLGGRFQVLNNGGVSGDTLTMILARHATDVAPYRPAWVLLADAVNDATAGQTAAQMITTTLSIITANKAVGARTILCTAPPSNAHTTGQRQALNDWNAWAKAITDPSVTPVDLATAVTDPATGNYLATYSDDGLHQNGLGAARLGRVLAATLSPLVAPRDRFSTGPTDTANAFANPWATGTPGAGLPTGWSQSGTATFSTVARTDLIPGNWMQIDTSAAANAAVIYQAMATLPFVAGDVVQLAVEVQADAWTSVSTLDLFVDLLDSAGTTTLMTIGAFSRVVTGIASAADQPLAPDVWTFVSPPTTVPAGAVKFQPQDFFNGQGKIRVGRHALIKV